jgi:hypothetical protein
MQRKTVSLAALTLALLSSCHSPTFDDTVQGNATVPGSTLGALLGALPPISGFSNFDFGQTQDFKNQGVSKSQVSSVKLTSMTVQITSPNNQDFSFLDSLEFDVTAPNQPQQKVAQVDNIQSLGLMAPNPTLVLQVDGVELQPYVTASTMSLTTTATGTQPSQDVELTATAVFDVTANLP